jgi:hypothetical protein
MLDCSIDDCSDSYTFENIRFDCEYDQQFNMFKPSSLHFINSQGCEQTRSTCVIQNHNSRLPSLRANPFIQDIEIDSSKPQPGFIVGHSGQIYVDSLATFLYAAMSCNIFPDFHCHAIPSDILNDRMPQAVIKQRNPSACFIDGLVNSSCTNFQFNDPVGSVFFIEEKGFMGFISGAGNSIEDKACGFHDEGINFHVDQTAKGLLGSGNIVLDVEAPLTIAGAEKSIFTVISSDFDVNNGTLVPETAPTFLRSCERVFPRIYPGNNEFVNTKANIFINSTLHLANATYYHNDMALAIQKPEFRKECARRVYESLKA